jgi:hypothetical protein
MDSYEEKERLRSKINVRKNLIKGIVSFTNKIVSERGTIVFTEVNRVAKKLEYFEGFSFCFVHTNSVKGGNIVQVWDRPIIGGPGMPGLPVLSVSYQRDSDVDQGNFTILVFDRFIDDWWNELKKIMDRKDEIIAQIEQSRKDQQERERQRRLQIQTDDELAGLLKEAERLRIDVQ